MPLNSEENLILKFAIPRSSHACKRILSEAGPLSANEYVRLRVLAMFEQPRQPLEVPTSVTIAMSDFVFLSSSEYQRLLHGQTLPSIPVQAEQKAEVSDEAQLENARLAATNWDDAAWG